MGYSHFRIQLLISLLIASASTTHGQYYYGDLVSLEETEKKQENYKKHHVRKITESAILPTGEKKADFLQWSEISRGGEIGTKYKTNYQQPVKTTYRFQSSGRLILQQEEQPDMRNEIRYEYDTNEQVVRIESVFIDSLMDFKDHEIHLWQYDQKGRPTRMWRLVEQFEGGYDSTEIRFYLDSAGRVTEEKSFKKGKETGFFYYFYNEASRITDIVRYNERWKRLLPDQLFEYDEAGRIIQKMMLTGSREVAYLIWRYGYDRNGLLTEEALFNNKKEHTGSIRFSYEYY